MNRTIAESVSEMWEFKNTELKDKGNRNILEQEKEERKKE